VGGKGARHGQAAERSHHHVPLKKPALSLGAKAWLGRNVPPSITTKILKKGKGTTDGGEKGTLGGRREATTKRSCQEDQQKTCRSIHLLASLHLHILPGGEVNIRSRKKETKDNTEGRKAWKWQKPSPAGFLFDIKHQDLLVPVEHPLGN